MRHSNDSGFADRRKSAADAKSQLLAKFASAPKPTDPAMQEKLAARKAISLAREARRSDRVAMQAVENERLLAEAASKALAKEAEEKAEAEARQAELASQACSLLAYEAVRKAERNRRYAARKARQC